MKKKLIAIIAVITLLMTSVIPALAAGGDNTGEDNFGANIIIESPGLSSDGNYTLGEDFTFIATFYASNAGGLTANREIKITSDKSYSDFQYMGKSGDDFGTNLNTAEWRNVELFNTQITVKNDVDRQFKVKFKEDGVYAIDYAIVGTDGKVIARMITRYITIQDGKYSSSNTAPETPTEEPSTTVQEPTDETSTEEILTTAQEPTDETSTEEISTTVQEPTDETSTEEISTTVQEPTGETSTEETSTMVQQPTGETSSEETSTMVQQPTGETVSTTMPDAETTTKIEVTTTKVTPTTKLTLKRATVTKATKKKSAKRAKITLKRVKKISGYQIQICKNKKFSKKRTVTRHTKKFVYTFTKLEADTKYYVRARVYVKVKGTKKFGPWSIKKRVKFVK